MKKKIYAKPEIAVYEMEAESLLAGSPVDKGDGHEHDNTSIVGDDDGEWF